MWFVEHFRLAAGVLQLAQGTHVTINETCIQSGTLSSKGIENARLLKNLLELQKVSCNLILDSS